MINEQKLLRGQRGQGPRRAGQAGARRRDPASSRSRPRSWRSRRARRRRRSPWSAARASPAAWSTPPPRSPDRPGPDGRRRLAAAVVQRERPDHVRLHHAAHAARVQGGQAAGFNRFVGCYRPGGPWEHPKGRACDWSLQKSGFRRGQQRHPIYGNNLAAFLIRNADRLGIYYVIWNRQIWFPATGWSSYSGRTTPTTYTCRCCRNAPERQRVRPPRRPPGGGAVVVSTSISKLHI